MSPQSRLVLLTTTTLLAACATVQENPHYQHSTKYTGSSSNSAYASNSAQPQTLSTAKAGTVLARYVHEDPNQPLGDVPGSLSTVSAEMASARNVITHSAAQPNSSAYASAAYAATRYTNPSYSRVDAICIEQGTQNTVACPVMTLPIASQSAAIAAPYSSSAQTLYVTSRETMPIAPSPTETAMPDSYGTPGYEAMKNTETALSAAQVNSQPRLGVPVPVTQPFASPLPAPTMRQAVTPDMMPLNQQSYTLGSQHQVVTGDTVYSFARSLCSSVEEIKAMNSLDGRFKIRLGDTIRLPASKC